MPYDRRPDRRGGGGRPSGPGRPMGARPPFGDRPAFGDRPSRPRDDFEERSARPREGFTDRPSRPRDEFSPQPARSPRPEGFAPRPMDDGGMSIRLDPRRLNALKLLAAEAGVRPGELVTRWVEERLDAARPGAVQAPTAAAIAPDALRTLALRVDELAARLDAMTAPIEAPSADLRGEVPASAEPAAKPRRGRPRKAAVAVAKVATDKPRRGRPRKAAVTASPKPGKVALHEEIAAVIAERGPQTAAELASAISERGIYLPPRSAKPLDAAIVNARVSNAKYRPRFSRAKGRIGLAGA